MAANEIFIVFLAHLIHVRDESFTAVFATLIISTVAGFVLYLRSRLEWRSATFESRINISINIVVDGVLRIRTILEDDVKDVILSPYARRLVKKAGKKTTLKDEFLRFENERDAWLVYNDIINAISSIYGEQILFAALHGKSAFEEQFLVAITMEKDAEVRIQKLRVIVIQATALRGMGRDNVGIRPEVPEQHTRISTLTKMRKQFVRGVWPKYQTMSLPRV